MTDTPDADLAQFVFEAVKAAYRQTKDGFYLTITIHPSDVPTDLALAPLGTRYKVGMLAIGDDEQPVLSEPLHHKVPKLSVIGKEQYRDADDMTRARTRAALLAKDSVFQEWADQRSNYIHVHDEDSAAEYIRERCGIASRSIIATEKIAYNAFVAMEAAYLSDTDQMAERRA